MKQLTKKKVQKRVLQNGKPIPLHKFSWDKKTKTFSSSENHLVINFKDIFGCTFDTGSGCTFDTGSDCTFKTEFGCTFKTEFGCTFDTGSGCTFDTGSGCTFKTGSDCTFDTGFGCTFKTEFGCVIVRRDFFQVIQPEINQIIKLCPYNIPGYISRLENEDCFYMDIAGKRTEYIIADNILSKVISKRKGVYKVINHEEKKESFLIEKDEIFSHGKTLKEAKESFIYKISNRDTSKYKDLTIYSIVSFEDAIRMYRTITGACERATKNFVENELTVKKDKYTVSEVINLTKGKYNNQLFSDFFEKKQN